jgi:hypothetical protein
MVSTSGLTSNAKPSLLLCDLGLTENLTVQVTLLGFIILKRSLPSVFLPAIKVPNQKSLSKVAKILEVMMV